MLNTRLRISQTDEKFIPNKRAVTQRSTEHPLDLYRPSRIDGLSQRQNSVFQMQQTHGNAAVLRMLSSSRSTAPVQRCGATPCNCSDDERAAHMMDGADGANTPAVPVARKPDDSIQRMALASLNDSPIHLRRTCKSGSGWEFEYDGCSLPPAAAWVAGDKDNPAGGSDTQFANSKQTGACDKHDRCYQTCNGTGGGGRAGCDKAMYDDMMATCNSTTDGWWRKQQCKKWAGIYYAGLRVGGGSAWKERQAQVCPCTPTAEADITSASGEVASSDQEQTETEYQAA